jgi:D-3-phosphoglycerate dehydrogenase
MFGRELRGKTVGIIGYGAIGQEVAKRLAGFDCQIEVYDPFYRPDGKEQDRVVFRENIDELLPVVDVLTLHCTLDDSTRGMISEREFCLMKPAAGIINAARAQIIDEEALERAIKTGRIAFAALDVFQVEPPDATHPLLGLENVILTPHLSSWTPEALHREVSGAIDSVMACFRGEKIPGLINPDFETFRRL